MRLTGKWLARWVSLIFALQVFAASAQAETADSPFDRYPIYFTTVNDTAIAYQDMGPETAEPVLLIMGLGAQMLHWGDTFVQGLLDAGYRVVLLDNRDAGLSQKFYQLSAPPVWWALVRNKVGLHPEPPYTLGDMAADAVGVLDVLGIEQAHVIGASMGGMIAQVLTAEHPQRVKSFISVMSSSGAPGLTESSPQAVAALASGATVGETRSDDIASRVEIARTIGSPEYFSEPYARQLASRVLNRGTYAPGVVRQFEAILASGDRSSLLQRIKVPALVVHGEDDPLLPLDHGRDTASKIPGARFVAIPGMGHALEPEVSRLVLAHLVPFLREPGRVAAGN